MTSNHLDQNLFRRLLIQNLVMPLSIGIVSSAMFVGIVFYLLDQLQSLDHSQRVISQANYTVKLLIDAETGLRGFVISNKLNFREPYDRSIPLVPENLDKLERMTSDNSIQVARMGAIRMRYTRWLAFSEEVISLSEKNRNMAGLIATGRGKVLMDDLRDQFELFLQVEENLRNERRVSVEQSVRSTLMLIVFISLICAAVVAFMARRQMKTLAQSYENSLNLQQKQNSQLLRQQWLREGEATLTGRMVGEKNLDQLSQDILNYIVEYLGAAVGSMYVINDEKVFQRQASFAFDVNEPFQKTFRAGVGFLGQVVSNKKIKRFNELPRDYFRVRTSLGEISPHHVKVIPIVSGEESNSLIELGFINESDSRVPEFFELVSENIFVAVKSALYRERLQRLLEEVQAQSEELQVQQEELRTNNEELEVQTNVLKETQARMELQNIELERGNAQLEKQAQMLEAQKEDLNRKNDDLEKVSTELEDRARELSRASQYKSEFLANMSHELRTPLNSSLILAKLLADNRDGNLTAQQIQFAQQIETSGNDLLTLINDILDLAKVESGKLDIVIEDFSLDHLLQSLRKSFEPIAHERKLEFSIKTDNMPHMLSTDEQRVGQILRNLLSNAFKFTSEGSISVNVNIREGWMEFAVKDSGIGISKDKQNIIFEAFQQADGTTNRRFGGTGLGLSISRDLARLLGGSISLESEEGKGSTFTLTIPMKLSATPAPKHSSIEPVYSRPSDLSLRKEERSSLPASTAAPAKNPVKKKFHFVDDREALISGDRVVLVVEDDISFVRIMFDLAHEQKFKCLVAETAEEAIEIANRWIPDAVLLDMKLPDHSGLVVLDRLKQSSRTRHIPVHIISAQDFSKQAMEMGAIGYILKPAKRDQLVDAFKNLESKIQQRIRKVLVIEDDRVQREAIQKLIEGTQVETVAVALGKEALEKLRQESFDCLIMDLILPDMTGFDLLDQMTQDEKHSYPPIIIYTARQLTPQEEDRLRTHSQSVIIKGARSPERLLDEVTLFLHRVETQLPPDQQQMLSNLRNREKIFDSKSILIVDDDMRNVFALTSALEHKGAQIHIARNGEEALKRLEENHADLVLMDIMMPVMDGYQAMREIRKNPAWAKLPIIALTAKAMKDDRERCLEAGANDYLSKPVDVEKLLSLIRVWISLNGNR